LTTKDQGVISREPQKPTTPQQHHPTRGSHHRAQPDPGSYSWKLLLIKDARVHYVVLKQQPRTTHPTHQPLANSKKVNSVQGVAARKPETHKTHTPHPPPTKKGQTRTMVLLSQDPTVCQTLPTRTPTTAFQDPLKRGSVLTTGEKPDRHLFIDIPPMSTRRRTIVCATGLLLTTPPHKHCGLAGLL